MIRTVRALLGLLRGDAGATAIEYALLASLIAAAIVTIVASIGAKVLDLFVITF